MTSFWSIWVIVLTLACLFIIFGLLVWNLKNYAGVEEGESCGHEFDGIEELNNPLPKWWTYMFFATFIWSVYYLAAYPGLGNWEGLGKWTSSNQGITSLAESKEAVELAKAKIEQLTADVEVDKIYEGDGVCSDAPCETEINEANSMCYKATSYATTRLIANKLGLKEEDYTVCFQSRLDKNWLTPFSDKVVEEQGRKGAKKLLAFSPAFVADCLETVIEIGHEYQGIFEDHGGQKIQLVPSSNDHERFIDGLEDIIKSKL